MSALQQTPYVVSDWDDYARVFTAVTPGMQLAIYREACQHLQGNVVDCGSGTAKIAPLLSEDPSIDSYTGIDYSKEMVNVAQQLLQKLNRPDFSILHSRIEDVSGSFSSAVSIQSYYSWPDPQETLKAIFRLLAPGATFVLATPNLDLKPNEIARELKQELIAHPDFEAFWDYNLKLAGNPQANFIEMDQLLEQVRQAGFKVQECHQKHLLGGMNFLVLMRGD